MDSVADRTGLGRLCVRVGLVSTMGLTIASVCRIEGELGMCICVYRVEEVMDMT